MPITELFAQCIGALEVEEVAFDSPPETEEFTAVTAAAITAFSCFSC